MRGWIDVVAGVAGWIGTSLALIILGWLGLEGPPPNWACIVLVFGGVAGLVTFLPLFWYAALIIFAIPNFVQFRQMPTARS